MASSNPGVAVDDVARRGESNSSLRHVLLVGGTLCEWAGLSEANWHDRASELGGYCARIGVPWLTIRAYESGDVDRTADLKRQQHSLDGCDVLIDPCGDGRQRFADAMGRLDRSDEVNEASVAAVLYEPADSEPDLVVVLGPPTQLPPSLVWELAYAELVFAPVTWRDLGAVDLERAVADFASRRRRFGGLDE